MSLGIYCYIDKRNNSIVYVGKDSNIDKDKRNREHHAQSNYKYQKINQVVQNNPNRYTYQVLVWDVKDQNTLNALEIHYIHQLKPKFNFTDGGNGTVGFIPSKETRNRMSEAKKGHIPWNKGKKLCDEHKQRISKSKKGFKHSEKTKDKISKNNAKYWQGKIRSSETKRKISRANKGKLIGNKHPMAFYDLWDNHKVGYSKYKMFRNNREPNPVGCFYLKYDGKDVNVGGFIDFVTPTLINDFIKENDKDGAI